MSVGLGMRCQPSPAQRATGVSLCATGIAAAVDPAEPIDHSAADSITNTASLIDGRIEAGTLRLTLTCRVR